MEKSIKKTFDSYTHLTKSKKSIQIFDSSIPHKGTIPNNQAPTFRFTLNSTWE